MYGFSRSLDSTAHLIFHNKVPLLHFIVLNNKVRFLPLLFSIYSGYSYFRCFAENTKKYFPVDNSTVIIGRKEIQIK